ncbi:signal recognition particle, SRP19 subunit [Mycotypha africana]|uniref:signal recognition particle, SRP19 subunit n=1 Tax=Mycotypha africana TaxID=64632 RepID=UPI0023001082|nr:signal recognition particle, SRP19 subunit [Mycotypha africana]KAI8973587.1 signal recognition particle, SRP19 subunit [Mycotypha africana]
MSMLDNLKKTKKNPVFLDDDDVDIDNMDFPLPTDTPPSRPSSSSRASASNSGFPNLGGSSGMPDMAQLQKMMESLNAAGGGMAGNAGPSTSAPAYKEPEHVTVATTPQGVVKLQPEDYKDWVCVYPCYINAEMSYKEGRKLSKEKCTKNPHAYHMALACQKLGLSVVYEGKRHPRDWANVGRVRVQLKDKNNFFIKQDIITRKQLFEAISRLMPQCQKESEVPKTIVSPLTTMTEVNAMIDEQRKAQGLPTLAEMEAEQAKNTPSPQMPPKQKMKRIQVRRR